MKSQNFPIHKYLHAVAAVDTIQAIDILEKFLYKSKTFYLSVEILSKLLHSKACDALIRFAEEIENPLYDRSYVLEKLPRHKGLWVTRRICNLLFQNASGLSPRDKLMIDYLVSDGAFTLFGAKIALCQTQNSDLYDELIRLLADASDAQRRTIVYIMVQQNRPSFIPLFNSLISDPDFDIRGMALQGLARLHENPNPNAILQGLKTAIENDLPIYDLCEAAGELKLTQAVPLLSQSFPKNTADANIVVTEALGKIGGAESLAILIESKDQLLYDEDLSCCKENYLQALVRIGEPIGLQVIIDYGTSSGIIKAGDSTRYLSYLERVRNPSAIPFLCDLLYHSNSDVRYYSMMALSTMGCEKAIPGFVALLSDEEEWIRNNAYRAITRNYEIIKDPDAIASLVNALCHTEHLVRDAALIGLRNVPPSAISQSVRTLIRKIISLEPENYIFDEAVRTYSVIGDSNTARYFWGFFTNYDYSIPLETWKYRRETIWFALGQIRFLPFLIEHLPETRALINPLCEHYGFRVLPNRKIILPDGQELPVNEAVKWLIMREKQPESVPNSQ